VPKDYARLSITVPLALKEQLEALGEFPYGNVTNAAKVLMLEALASREGKQKPKKDEIIQALIEIDNADDLLEIAAKALEKARSRR